MKRAEFIKKIALLGGSLSALPSFTWIKKYRKFYLLQSFVRGFRYYRGSNVIDQFQTGSMLQLVREPENEHDETAIALYFNQFKIGYIPAESNEIIAKLMDINIVEFHCEVTDVNLNAPSWEKVSIAIYVLKEVTGVSLSSAMEKLTVLETSEYLSVKNEEDFITRFYYDSTDDIEYKYGN